MIVGDGDDDVKTIFRALNTHKVHCDDINESELWIVT
jgi:hypothetical protein